MKLVNKKIEINGIWQLISKYIYMISDQSEWCLEDEFWWVIRLEKFIFLFLSLKYGNKIEIIDLK